MSRLLSIFSVLLCFVIFAKGSFAQEQMIGASSNWNYFDTPKETISTALLPPFAPMGTDVAFNYFQSNTPPQGYNAPIVIGQNILVIYGERITLPSNSGFIDSLSIEISAISNDSIQLLEIPDTLYSPTGARPFHIMNVFDPTAKSSLIGYIHASQIQGRTIVTFKLPHVPVPQNFWIGLQPNFNKTTRQFTNAYQLIGDSESIRVRTIDNTHSGVIALNSATGQPVSAIFDSTFTGAHQQPLYSNFNITAYVDVTSSGVADRQGPNAAISVYPNPSTSILHVHSEGAKLGSLNLVDMLGRTVLTSEFTGSTSLDVSKLQPGRYEAVVRTANGISHSPVVIQ